MEKEIIIWTFITVFIVTAIITLLGIIQNCRLVVVEDKYLKVLSSALILEVIAVIIGFGVSSFNEISLETKHKKEINQYKSIISNNNKIIESLNAKLIEVNGEMQLKSNKINDLTKEKQKLLTVINDMKLAETAEKKEEYDFGDAKKEFHIRPIYFVSNTDEIDSLSFVFMDSLVDKIGKYRNINLKLHPVTPWLEGKGLIKMRQKSIREYLVAKGFPPHNIIFITMSRYANDSDEIYNEKNVLIEKGMILKLELKDVQ